MRGENKIVGKYIVERVLYGGFVKMNYVGRILDHLSSRLGHNHSYHLMKTNPGGYDQGGCLKNGKSYVDGPR